MPGFNPVTYGAGASFTTETVMGAGAIKGKDGKSAYQIAVAHGFSGTEEQWLESLKAYSNIIVNVSSEPQTDNYNIEKAILDTIEQIASTSDISNGALISLIQPYNNGDSTLLGSGFAILHTDNVYSGSIAFTSVEESKIVGTYVFQYDNISLIYSAIESSGGGGEGTSAELTSDLTTNTEVGGIPAGKTYSKGTKLEDILKNMLVKYIAPAITTSISPSTSPLYVGDTVASVTITANVTKNSYPIKSVKFYAGGTLVNEVTTGVENGGTFTYKYTPDTPISATTSFYASVTDGTQNVNGTTRTITFVNASYFGTVASTLVTPSASDITALTKMKLTSKAYTASNIAMTYGKILFAYPKSYGALTSIKDANNVDYINSYTRSEVSIDGVDYYCYLLTDAAGVSAFKQIYA